jgi:hypothetical protein
LFLWVALCTSLYFFSVSLQVWSFSLLLQRVIYLSLIIATLLLLTFETLMSMFWKASPSQLHS